MELWQVRKVYRQVAFRLRSKRAPMNHDLERVEERVVVTLALCDRTETELCVLRLARRCAYARLKRLRTWVENAGLMKDSPARLARKKDEDTLEDLERDLLRRGLESAYLRQALDEVAHLDRRMEETRARLARIIALAATCLQLLLTHLKAPVAEHA
jgi:hypothetical protein